MKLIFISNTSPGKYYYKIIKALKQVKEGVKK